MRPKTIGTRVLFWSMWLMYIVLFLLFISFSLAAVEKQILHFYCLQSSTQDWNKLWLLSAFVCLLSQSQVIINASTNAHRPLSIHANSVQTVWMKEYNQPRSTNYFKYYYFSVSVFLLFLFVRLCAQRFTLSHRNWNRLKCTTKIIAMDALPWRWWRR